MNRRDILTTAAALLASQALPARAQTYPSRPVHIVVGFPAGGTTDIVARVIAQWLSERLGANFVVENKPGAGTNIATEAVVRAPADGHTLLVATPANTINATLYSDLGFDFVRDIVPITSLIRSPYVLEVIPSVPATTVPELIAHAKANPGKLNIGSFGVNSGSHLAGEMFKMMTGVEMNHVPYRGSAPMVTDLLGGQVQVAIDNLPASIEHIRAGKLRALAVTTDKRSGALPETPALAEILPGYEASSWLVLAAPRNTAKEIVRSLHQEVAASLAEPRIRMRLEGLGATVLGDSTEAAEAMFSSEIDKWARVIKFAGAKPN